jgi:hypothetical protein
MRQEILDYINTLALGGYLLSDELPWSDNDTPLYLKNLKKIYVDNTEYIDEPLIAALNGLVVTNEQQVTRIYFANDAKQLPANYEDLILDLKKAKDISTVTGVQRRNVEVLTSFENDVLVTEIAVTFTKLNR